MCNLKGALAGSQLVKVNDHDKNYLRWSIKLLVERIGSPHRTEIRYVLIWGQRGYHHKVKLGTNLGLKMLKMPFLHHSLTCL